MQTDAPPTAEDAEGRVGEQDEELFPAAAAAILKISPATLCRYARSGVVPSRRLPSGHRRYERSAIEAIRDGTYTGNEPDACP